MNTTADLPMADYYALAEIRYQIRLFLHFSEQAAREAGLEPQQHQLLLALKGLPEGNKATIRELAERLQLQHHSTVELINRLVERDFIKRLRDDIDRRCIIIHLDKPTIEIRAAGDVTVLKPPMSFVPGLSLFPTTTIRSAILKEISDILVQCRLILLGSEDIVPSKPMDLCAERTLGMHRIQGEDTPFDQVWGQYWLERTDLILFLLHIAMPQDDASGDLRATELVHRMRLRSGGSQGFAINSRMSVISLPLRRVQSAWFRSTALLGFEAAQKRLPRARPGA